MTASGRLPATSAASAGNDAPVIAPFQFGAYPLGRRLVQRPRLDAVVDAFLAEIDRYRVRLQLTEQVGIFALQPLPFLTRLLGSTQRTEPDLDHPRRRLGRKGRLLYGF